MGSNSQEYAPKKGFHRWTPNMNRANLAAQREIPANIAQDSIAEGVSDAFCLFFIGYRASIAEIPLLWGGGIAPPLRMLSKGETLRKGGGGIAPNWPC